MREFRKTSRKTMKPFDWSFWNGMAFDVSAPRRQECDMACSAAVQIVPSLLGVINQLQVLALTGQSEPFVDLLDGHHQLWIAHVAKVLFPLVSKPFHLYGQTNQNATG